MLYLPPSLDAIFAHLAESFTQPTAQRFCVLLVGAILARGRRTITGILRATSRLAHGHFSTYHRVWSRAPWSLWSLSDVLAMLVIAHFAPRERIPTVVDETTDRHRGPKVYGTGFHRDPVRSSRSRKVFSCGHQWVVLAIVVKFPFTRQPWSLPVMTALYRNKKTCKAHGCRHKTHHHIARQMLAGLMRRFPNRTFVLFGDGAYATAELAKFCSRHGHPLISRFRRDAAMYELPPQPNPGRRGRRRVKGERLDSPEQAAARRNAKWKTIKVDWYGGTRLKVRAISATGLWYNRRRIPVIVRWVYVRDEQGHHADECLFSTDTTMSPRQIISLYTLRWSIEVTFEEVRAHLGFETTRQRVKNSVLRMAPCLLGLYTVVSLAFAHQAKHRRVAPITTAWYRKDDITFSDALVDLRRQIWSKTVFCAPPYRKRFGKIPPAIRTFVIDQLTAAA
jgi:hypothetical protein